MTIVGGAISRLTFIVVVVGTIVVVGSPKWKKEMTTMIVHVTIRMVLPLSWWWRWSSSSSIDPNKKTEKTTMIVDVTIEIVLPSSSSMDLRKKREMVTMIVVDSRIRVDSQSFSLSMPSSGELTDSRWRRRMIFARGARQEQPMNHCILQECIDVVNVVRPCWLSFVCSIRIKFVCCNYHYIICN